jgi:hypothetical protein
MKKFAEEAFSCKFSESPNYEKLRKILHEAFAPKQELDTSSSSMEGITSNIDELAEKWSGLDNNIMDGSDKQVASVSIIPSKNTPIENSVINKVR